MTAAVAEAWGDWIAGMTSWDVFGGLTYDPERCRVTPGLRGNVRSMPGIDVVRAHAYRWLRAAPRAIGRPVDGAVVAIERHKNGWPHMHPLLKLNGGFQKGDLASLGQAWFHDHGYARLERPRDQGDVAAYASKYLAKDVLSNDVILFRLRDFTRG